MGRKVLFVSDTHFGCNRYSIVDEKSGLPSRLLDYKESFSTVLNYAIKNKVIAVIHSGDVFHRNIPTPTEEVVVLKELQKLEDAKIPTWIINGNHDYNYSSGRSHATGVLKASPWKYIKVYDDPEVQKDIDGIQFHFVPYPHTPRVLNNDVCRKVVVCHAHFAGAKVGAEEFLIAGGVPETQGLEGADLVISGHIHKQQEIDKGSYKIVYVGSMERGDFAERDEPKGFMLFDVDDLTYERISLDTREFIQFDFDSPSNINFNRDIEGKIVKVRVKCKESETKLIDFSSIREALKKAHFIASIDVEIEKDKKVRSSKITESLSVTDAFKQYLDLRKPQKRELVEQLGMKIIQGISHADDRN